MKENPSSHHYYLFAMYLISGTSYLNFNLILGPRCDLECVFHSWALYSTSHLSTKLVSQLLNWGWGKNGALITIPDICNYSSQYNQSFATTAPNTIQIFFIKSEIRISITLSMNRTINRLTLKSRNSSSN